MDENVHRVLQMYAVSVGTVSRGRDGDTGDLDGLAAIELEMDLRAVPNCNATHRDIRASVEPQSLQ